MNDKGIKKPRTPFDYVVSSDNWLRKHAVDTGKRYEEMKTTKQKALWWLEFVVLFAVAAALFLNLLIQ